MPMYSSPTCSSCSWSRASNGQWILTGVNPKCGVHGSGGGKKPPKRTHYPFNPKKKRGKK